MVLVIKHRFAYYKRFELDIWGLARSSLLNINMNNIISNYVQQKNNIKKKYIFFFNRKKVDFSKILLFKSKFISKICSFFFKLFLERQEYKNWRKKRYVYRIDIVKPQKKKHFFKKKFISLRLVKLFYLSLSYKTFRKIALKAKKQDGLFESNFLYLLEGRLVPIIYRSGLSNNMFEILSFVRSANVYINKVLYNNLNFSVKVYDLISFSSSVSRFLYLSLLSRLLRRRKKAILFTVAKFLFISYKLMCFFLKRHPKEKDLVFPVGIDIYRATGFFN